MHIAHHELKTVVLMLQQMVFYLSGKVVALHLDNSSAKAYSCSPGGIVYLSLSRQVCCILNLANNHSITLIPAYILWKLITYHGEG